MNKIIILGLLLGLAWNGFAKELQVKYPPLTAQESMQWAFRAAEWLAQEVEAGRFQEAIESLKQAPKFKMTESGWQALVEELNDPNLIAHLEIFRGQPFEEFKAFSYIFPNFPETAWDIVVAMLRKSEEVFSPLFNKGSLADYRFVISLECEKNHYLSHALLPHIVGHPIIDITKDDNGKRYIWDLCNHVLSTGKPVWMEAFAQYFKFHRTQMYLFIVPVGDTNYQIITINRKLDESLDTLNAMIP